MLEEYKRKRNFDKTKEPTGTNKKKKENDPRFVIQYHRARTTHYDLRLEFNGVLVSFAIPKGFPQTDEKRLAVHVEDHPLDYIDFEGVIPKGEYGAGTVEIFDKGKYERLSSFRNGLREGKLKFSLFGKQINGIFNMIRINGENWLIFRENSAEKKENLMNKKVKNPFKSVDVKLCKLVKSVPTSKEYIYEIKYDGYRIVAYLDNEKVTLKTRNDKDYTSKFSSIANSLKKLNKTMILDGEIVVFDFNGRSDFNLLQESIKKNKKDFIYVVFDILALDGKDLREKPLSNRKIILEENIKNSDKNIIYSEYVKNNGKKVFSYAKKNKLEGIVAKKIDSIYNSKRDEDWLKIKCYLRQEFVIIGYTKTIKNKKLSAIYVGYYKDNELYYIGKVGTGYSEKQREDFGKKLEKQEIKKSKIKNIEKISEDIIFVKPTMVCEVQFAEITKEGKLRQASFVGLRDDKSPKDVVLEKENERKES